MTGGTPGNVTGELTAGGGTKPVGRAVTFSIPPAHATGREAIALTGTTTINRRDFGMTAYSFIVGRKVRIIIKTRMVLASSILLRTPIARHLRVAQQFVDMSIPLQPFPGTDFTLPRLFPSVPVPE